MIKGKELLGRPIVAVSNGEQVDNVHDVVFDHQGNRVLALLAEEGGWFSAAKAVPFERIQSIGEKAVMIPTPEDVVNTKRDPVLKEAMAGKTNLIGMTLLTTEGETLGKISDVYFDERTGRVEGYEATGGFFADMTSGRTFIPVPDSIQIGKDSAIVPATVAAAMREQAPGGIRGAFHTAGQSVTGAVKSANDSVNQGLTSVTQRVSEAAQDVGQGVRESYQQANSALLETQEDALVGRRVQQDVRSDTGALIAAQGQIVTPAVVDRARSLNAEGELQAAVLAASAERIGENVRESAAELRDNLADGLTQVSQKVSEGASGLLGKAKAWLGEQKEAVEDAATHAEVEAEAQRIRDAVGRRVSRTVLSRTDRIILREGDTVTNAAIDEARAAGVLDVLLDSVDG